MEAIIPYLTFNGQAEEALVFYANALDGKVLYKQSFGETDMGSKVDPQWKDKIMHAAFQADKLEFMVSDTMSEQQIVKGGDQVSLSLNFTEEKEIDRVFKALAQGGKIIMELQKTFWGAKFGMLKDRFGIQWMFNHDLKPGE